MSEPESRIPPDCEKAMRALWAYLDRSLSTGEIEELDAHLARCEGCRSHMEFERELLARIRSVRREHPQVDLLRASVRAALAAGAAGGKER